MRSIAESTDRPANIQRALTWAVFLGAAGVVVYLCVSILRPFTSVIAWSAVLTIICYPVHQWLVRKTGRVALSALITSVLTVLAFVIPLLAVGGTAVKECVALGHSLEDVFQTHAQPLKRAATALAWITGRVGLDQATIAAWIQQHISEWAGSAGQYTVSVAAGLLDAVVSSIFVIFTMFLLLRDGQALVGAIPDFLPFERQRSESLLRRIIDVVQASVYGVVVIAIMQGALCGAMFWVLGIPAAALWGMVTVFASVLPVVGAFAVWGPGALYLAMTGQWPHAILLAIWGTFVVSGIDNVVRPRLVAGRVGLSELAMFFALLGGLSVFGGLGVVLGPVAFATVAAIVDTLREPTPAAPSAVGAAPTVPHLEDRETSS
jgi:predicted PurR-regulated permease PerM